MPYEGCKATGKDAMACEARRIRAVRKAARVPDLASPVIQPAPARGPVRVAPQMETVMTPSGPRTRRATTDGHHPVQAEDAFDKMALQVRRRAPKAQPPFTEVQIESGRAYAALVERVASEGVRCASLEAGRAGGTGGGRDWIEGVIARSDRLERMRAAIGEGVALSPRGVQAHADRGWQVVGRRQLVDAVCCEGRTLSEVLRRSGWSVQTPTLKVLRAELAAALDRLWGL